MLSLIHRQKSPSQPDRSQLIVNLTRFNFFLSLIESHIHFYVLVLVGEEHHYWEATDDDALQDQ